ncbi:MAG: hypothetical protein M1815_000727 [Lichina confinis]|nr:MAG: hypothetical protein M1815_000727 [Lichina confinis]
MARSKASARSTSSTPTPSSSSSSSSSSPPEPFTRAPAILSSFLSGIDPRRLYIIHVDSHPRFFKLQVFAVPFATNVVLAALLVWRAYVILPVYLLLLVSTLERLGNKNGTSVRPGSVDGTDLLGGRQGDVSTIFWRAGNFLFDLLLWQLVLPWPRRFFVGGHDGFVVDEWLRWPESAWGWKWRVGFHHREVIVRAAKRSWWSYDGFARKDGAKAEKSPPSLVSLTDDSNPMFRSKILPAINEGWMKRRSGYMFLDADWDLDFDAMTLAHAEIKDRTSGVSMNDFRKMLVLHTKEFGWVVWKVWELDAGGEKIVSWKGREGKIGDEDDATEKEARHLRRKMDVVRNKLITLDKEDLFYRWIELVQYESSSPFETPFATAKIPPPPPPPPPSASTSASASASTSTSNPTSLTVPSTSRSSPSTARQRQQPRNNNQATVSKQFDHAAADKEQRQKRQEMSEKVQRMFSAEGIDMEQLWKDVEREAHEEK